MIDQTIISTYLPEEKGKKPMIYVDSREAANSNGKRIINLMGELGANIVVTKLDFGDYLLGEDIAIERKTVFDLANSLTQRFLFDQIFEMKKAYPHSIVLLEGYMGLLRKFNRISQESLSGALFTLTQANISLIPTMDYRGTAMFLVISAKQLLKNGNPHPIIRHKLKNKKIEEQQLFVVSGLPHIGLKLGRVLLSSFKTVRAVFSSTKEELMEVRGIGAQIAEAVMNVLDTPYNGSIEKK